MKSSLEINPLIQNCVQQDYIPELYPWFPLLIKYAPSFDVVLLTPPGVDCQTSPEPWWETLEMGGGGGGNPTQQPKNKTKHPTLSPNQKNLT